MDNLDVEPADYVLLDLFPCTVTGPQGLLGDQFRVILTDNHLYVIVDAPTGPELALKVPHPESEGYSGSLTAGYEVAGYTITKQSSCGCGSRLRSIYPFLGTPFKQTK